MIKVAVCDDDIKFTGDFENIICQMLREHQIMGGIEVFF